MDVLADRYELGAPLGAGGMATVVAGHDRLLDRAVAVKLMRTDLSGDPSVRERFLREARSAAKFSHPNAVAVYDTGAEGRRPWIVMELVDGPTLADRLADGPLDSDEAAAVADAVLGALAAAHRTGLVHRDVKPANILLPADGGVKLTDFGIAKSVREAGAGITATGQVIGTASYLAPEQVDGRAATPASDVYAMGVVLYEMLAGQPPFRGDNAVAVALAHTRDPVPSLAKRRPGLDPGLVAVVERALAKDPAQRFDDADAMRAALRERTVAPAPGATAGTPARAATSAMSAVAAATVGAAAAPTKALPRAPSAATTRALAPHHEPRRGNPLGWILAAVAGIALIALAGLASQLGGRDAPRSDAPAGAGGVGGDGQGQGDGAGGRPVPASEPATEPPATEPPATQAPVTEPPATPPPATEPPASQPSASEQPATEAQADRLDAVGDLPGLAAVLDAEPGRYGERQPDLRDGIAEVLADSGDERGEVADDLLDDVAEWAADGELDPDAARVATSMLQPLAVAADDDGDTTAAVDDRRGDGSERGKGSGRGSGKGSDGKPGKGRGRGKGG